MKLFIHSGYSREYDGGYFNSTTNDIYSIDVQDYITINTLAHIIKDKENMTEHNFIAMRLIVDGKQIYKILPRDPAWQMSVSDQQLDDYRYLTNGKLNEIPYINDDSHIYIIFRLRG